VPLTFIIDHHRRQHVFPSRFGDDVENFLDRCAISHNRACRFGGDLLHMHRPRLHHSLIGASGGIAGVIHIYALAFPQAKIGFLWRTFIIFAGFGCQAWFVFVLWILFQIIAAYEQKIGISSVSSLGDLGGAAVGVIAWFLTRKSTSSAQA